MASIIVTIIAVIICFISFFITYKSGYLRKVLVKFGLLEGKTAVNWTAFSWNSSLEKMNLKADIVFFGDSIIRGGNFQDAFNHKKITNLGCSGDTLAGMVYRVNAIKTLSPSQIFILAGINGLSDFNCNKSIHTYEKLLTAIRTSLPEAEIYVHSVLPLSIEKQRKICKNKTIEKFNGCIEKMCVQGDITYIDLYGKFIIDNQMNEELTIDGIHLNEKGYELWFDELKKYIV
ncbi:MAG: GDSL-type esterase/lipase family protein [Acutalibacteraceae bacterium]|nr:GDSL-type esterase/lipase family protein [Acutalibacteraceae bacterium]